MEGWFGSWFPGGSLSLAAEVSDITSLSADFPSFPGAWVHKGQHDSHCHTTSITHLFLQSGCPLQLTDYIPAPDLSQVPLVEDSAAYPEEALS